MKKNVTYQCITSQIGFLPNSQLMGGVGPVVSDVNAYRTDLGVRTTEDF